MKSVPIFLLVIILLTGCGQSSQNETRFLSLRSQVQQAEGCAFDVIVTADYGDELYTFSLSCKSDRAGSVSFSVTEPASIAGITGTLDAKGGNLTFDDVMLAFPLLADGQVSPVSAPWLLYKTLAGGYLHSTGMEGDYLRVSVDDSYESDALRLDIWLDSNNRPIRGEVLYGGRRILSMEIKNFTIL